ncbi:5366_t:CDS:2, partial [Ambispora leptoticha]
STEGLDKPLCERYTFKYDNNKSTTLDITQELSDKLELNSKENFHVFKKVLTRSPEEGGITIKNENEIFIQKPLTINNLEKERQETITNLQEERDNLTNRLTELDQLLHGSAIIFGKQQHYINQITHQLQQEQNNITNSAEYNANLRQDLLTLAHTRKELQGTAFYTEDTPAVAILIEKVKGQRIIDLEQEKEELNSNLQTQHQQELTQKDDEITRLEKRIEDLEVERDARPRITLAK